jgi:hypothetical protein
LDFGVCDETKSATSRKQKKQRNAIRMREIGNRKLLVLQERSAVRTHAPDLQRLAFCDNRHGVEPGPRVSAAPLAAGLQLYDVENNR